MLNLITHKIKQGPLKHLALGLILLIFLFSTGFDFFHNHEPDLKVHHDCPAYHIFILLNSILITFLIFLFSSPFYFYLTAKKGKLPHKNYLKPYNSRDPPENFWFLHKNISKY